MSANSDLRHLAASDAVTASMVQLRPTALCHRLCDGRSLCRRIVDPSVASRLVSWEGAKAVVATKAGLVWFSDQFLTETWWDGLSELESLARLRHDRRR
jgi:hypothetical protein